MKADLHGFRVSMHPGSKENLAVIISGAEEKSALASLWDRSAASLLIVDCGDWNANLSPWPAPACFPKGDDFSGGADAFLNALTARILPDAEKKMELTVKTRAILGYSLAGLFAVYAALNTDLFHAAASVSGSMWFDGFLDYLLKKTPSASLAKVYFSLGDREEKTKNPRLAAVGECTRRAYAHVSALGIDAQYEINPGNHFFESDQRMLKALSALFPAGGTKTAP